MEKDYAEQLKDWVKAKGLKGHNLNLAAFLAVQDMVKERLTEGYSATAIFGFLRERRQIEFCYDTFLKYVHRYVQAPRKGPRAKRPKVQPNLVPIAKEPTPAEGTSKDSTSSGFTYNSIPRKEDLF